MASILQRLQLVADAAVEQADEVEPVQLELQTAVQVQQTLAIRHGPPGRDITQGEAGREESLENCVNSSG